MWLIMKLKVSKAESKLKVKNKFVCDHYFLIDDFFLKKGFWCDLFVLADFIQSIFNFIISHLSFIKF